MKPRKQIERDVRELMRTANEARFADRVRTYATFLSANERNIAAGYVLRCPVVLEGLRKPLDDGEVS
jgi:hypothetical protein